MTPTLDPAALAAARIAACCTEQAVRGARVSCSWPACGCPNEPLRNALEAYLSADPRAVEIERLTRERDLALVDLGRARMCVNCGKVMDADAVKPGDDMPECRDTTPGPTEGFAACQFDTTPQEAWQVWRDRWHEQHAEIAALRAQVAGMREAMLTAYDACDAQCHGEPGQDWIAIARQALFDALSAAPKPGEG